MSISEQQASAAEGRTLVKRLLSMAGDADLDCGDFDCDECGLPRLLREAAAALEALEAQRDGAELDAKEWRASYRSLAKEFGRG
jgi:hypothetical protein